MKIKKLTVFMLVLTASLSMFVIPASAAKKTNSEKYLDEIEYVLSLVPDDATDLEKVTIFYDWIVTNVQYNMGVTHQKNSMYGVFLYHESACEGFARALEYLFNETGVENKYMYGYNDGGPHAWNLVKMDGKWYHLDATSGGPDLYVDFLVAGDFFGPTWHENRYPKTSETCYIVDNRVSFKPKNGSIYYNKADNGEAVSGIMRYDSKTGKTTKVVKDGYIAYGGNLSDFWQSGGETDCIYYYFLDSNVDGFYNVKTGKSSEATIEGDIIAYDGDKAVFATYTRKDGKTDEYLNFGFDYFAVTTFNTKTQEIQTSNKVALDSRVRYAGTYNGKIYFYTLYDIFSYDKVKNKLTKLKRPSDIVQVVDETSPEWGEWGYEQYLYKVKVVESKGKTYLRWEIEVQVPDDIYASEWIIKQRKIT